MDEEPVLIQNPTEVHKGLCGNYGIFDKGPYGLGDPGDKSLSKTELELLIPTVQREIIERDYCAKEFNEYNTCYQQHNVFTGFFKCSNNKHNLTECINYWKDKNDIREKAIAEYIEERTLFRSTGMNKLERENYDETIRQREKTVMFKRRTEPLSEEDQKLNAWRLYQKEKQRIQNEKINSETKR